jgi:hypothetical protein
MARRIWLAGIGAYGRAFEEGRDMVRGLSGDLSDKTSEAFESLAEKGERIEIAAKVKGAQLAGKASEMTDGLQSSLALDDRIQAMRNRLSGNGTEDRVEALEAQLARIETKLDALIKAQATPAAKGTTTKRTTTQRTSKTTAKKAPAKKTAAKTTTTKKTPAKKTPAKKSPAKKTTPKKSG